MRLHGPRQLHKHVDEGKAPERWVSFLGFVLVTKSDLLAAAAFLLSLLTAVYQFSSWVKGPSPSVYAPDVVYIFFDEYPNNKTIVRFAAQMSFVNTAEVGHDAIVRNIGLNVAAKDDLGMMQEWLSFVMVQRNGKNIVVTPKETAHPFPVVASSSISYTVSFAPLEQPCRPTSSGSLPSVSGCNSDKHFVTDTEFLNKIATVDELNLTFSVRFVGVRRPLFAACTLPVGVGLRQYLAENGSFAVRCQSQDDPLT